MYRLGLAKGRKELEKENEEIKAKLYSDSKKVFAELNEETARSNAELLDLVEDLKARIEKMKTLFEIIKNRSCTTGIYNIAVEGMELAE